jgi:hypothetical protein
LKVYGRLSTIQLVSPLTKEQVSTDNGGGGNWGAENCADTNQIKTMTEAEMEAVVAAKARGKAALLAKFPVGCYVTWTGSDSDVPDGTVGVIGSVNAESEKASVQFPKGTWNLPLLTLQQSTKAARDKQ